ncbi:hypothetical protein [Kineococcus sp. GCM10028916]|uniref:hypothetical protein n=1 Tax=Kineococcus sp. GCM10028916 TaxID=3273394 RepID=UPI0036D34595
MGFEVFEKKSAPLAKVPNVTIQRRGLLSLNRAAYALLKDPEAVLLMWDADRKIIGLKAASIEEPNAYPARPQSTKTGKGPIMVAGTLFTQYYKIDTTESRRWIPFLEDDVLCIDLSKDGQKVVSNRNAASND